MFVVTLGCFTYNNHVKINKLKVAPFVKEISGTKVYLNPDNETNQTKKNPMQSHRVLNIINISNKTLGIKIMV